jgi:methanogenic corrinoid protein MtbC1
MENWQVGAALAALSEASASSPGTRRAAETVRPVEVRADDVESLAKLSIAGDMERINAFVQAVRARPVALEAIYLDLLQGAARKLGEWWLADVASFADVTVGTSRLQHAMREIGPAFRSTLELPVPGRMLLAPASGEQHTFGLAMVADFLLRAGFDVDVAGSVDEAAHGLARGDWYDLVGVSVGCRHRLDALAADIARLRGASCNRRIGVMVGGPVFVAHSYYATRVGADATAIDAREAPDAARQLLASIMHPS